MRGVGRRLWPAGLAGRLTLVLVVMLLVVLWVGAGLYVHDRAHTTMRLFSESISQRIAVIVPLLERTVPADRAELLRAVDSPTLRVGVTLRPWPAPRRAARWAAGRHMDKLREVLPDLGARPVEIRALGRWRPKPSPSPALRRAPLWVDGPHRDLQHSRAKVGISVGLETGGWVHFIASAPILSLRWAFRAALWMAAATAVLLGVVFWAAFQMTRPLRRFADAAERIGLDVRSPPLHETGSRELRNAARAFNRMQERLRHLVDDRTMMLAAISHDLRTMLTRLRLRAEFIGDEEQRGKAVADLEEMHSMLDSTLAFARDDAAHEPRTSTDLTALVRSLCDDMADAGHAVSCEGTDRLAVSCAPVAVRRAVSNILANAVKYGGRAEVRIIDSDDGPLVEVADRGPGIPAHLREAAFRPFYRLEASRNRETGGSGLGLAVARSVMRRHGGDVSLLDRAGGGLVVRLHFPAASERAN